MGKPFELARKHALVAVVIADRREGRGVRGECDCGKRTPFVEESSDELRHEVLRVGRATAISTRENLVAAMEAFVS